MKLKVLKRYRSPRGAYVPGEEIDVDEEMGRYLLADAPGCFKIIEAQARDKMMRGGQRKRPPTSPGRQA